MSSFDPPNAPNDLLPPDVPQQPGRSGLATAFPLAVAAVVVLAVGAVVAVVGSGGGGDDDTTSGSGGTTTEATTTTLPSNVGSVSPPTTEADTGGGGSGAGVDIPPVTIPAESSPPTTIPGSEPNSIPVDIMSGEEIPQWGTLVVDLEEGGYQDFAVHLRREQRLQLLSLGDDGIETDIEVFAPDGSSEGSWRGGEPGVINGFEWYGGDRLPSTGTYVIRVVHRGGSHDPFALGFFGDP